MKIYIAGGSTRCVQHCSGKIAGRFAGRWQFVRAGNLPGLACAADNGCGATAARCQTATPVGTGTPAGTSTSGFSAGTSSEVTEDELRRMLVGKQLFLRGGYMDNDLNFSESGTLVSHSPQGSFTLSAVQIEKVQLTKRKVVLEGTRYGLHFLGALAYEDTPRHLRP